MAMETGNSISKEQNNGSEIQREGIIWKNATRWRPPGYLTLAITVHHSINDLGFEGQCN